MVAWPAALVDAATGRRSGPGADHAERLHQEGARGREGGRDRVPQGPRMGSS